MENKLAKVPSNVKLIGQAPEEQKIYIEDYVMTYLKQTLNQEKKLRVSVLYGRKEMIGDKLYWFVHGAIEACPDFFMDKTILDEQSWQHVNEVAEKFFPDFAILGWAMTGGNTPGNMKTIHDSEFFELFTKGEQKDTLSEQIIRTQKTFFRSDQKLFYEFHSDSNEERIFLYEKGKMKQQSGFYIFYDRNENMQNYMVSLRVAERSNEEYESDRVIRYARKNVSEQKKESRKKKSSTFFACLCMMLVMTIMVISMTMMNGYEMMQNMQTTLHQITDRVQTSIENGKAVVSESVAQMKTEESSDVISDNSQTESVMNETSADLAADDLTQDDTSLVSAKAMPEIAAEDSPKQPEDTDQQNIEPQDTEQQATESQIAEPQETEQQDTEQQDTEQQDTEQQDIEQPQTVAQPEKTDSYIIQKGDTLASISLKFYGTLSKMDEICLVNHIEDKDNILYGQKIVLP